MSKNTGINGNPKDDKMSLPMTALWVIGVIAVVVIGTWYMTR